MTDDLVRFIDSGGNVRCRDREERHEVLKFLQEVGYVLGFDEKDFSDREWPYVYLSGKNIHMGGDATAEEDWVVSFQDLLALYAFAEDDLPEPDELPDPSELFPVCIKEDSK